MTNTISYIDISKGTRKNDFLGNVLLGLSIFLLVLYSVTPGMTATIFGPNGRGMYAVFLFAIVAFGKSCSPRFSLDNARPTGLLILLILMIVFFNNNYNIKKGSLEQLAFLYTFFIVSVFGAYSNVWHKHLLNIYIFFSSFFLIMTYAELVNPTFFISNIMPLFSEGASVKLQMINLRSGYVAGFSANPAINVSVLALGLASLFSLWLNSSSHKKKLFFLVILFLLTMFITGKRGPTLFAVCALTYAYFYSKAENGIKKAIMFILIVLSVVMAFSIIGEFVPEVYNTINRITNNNSSQGVTTGRDFIWKRSLSFFYSSPIVGTGWDSLKYLTNTNAHNVYIQLLCEVGMFCAIIFYAFFIISFVHVNVAIKRIRTEGKNVPPILSFSLIFQIYFLLYCLTGNPLYDAFTALGYLMSCSAGEYYYHNQSIKIICLPIKGKYIS